MSLTQDIVLENQSGIRWGLNSGDQGWTLGTIAFYGQMIEVPNAAGLLAMRNIQTGEQIWLTGATGEKLTERSARLSGQSLVDDVQLTYSVEIVLSEKLPVATFAVVWSVDSDLAGWEVILALHDRLIHEWRCHLYPFAENSELVDIKPLAYCGVPAALMHHPDMSLVMLFGIDPSSDYLNPTTWTGKTGFCFKNGMVPPQFHVGNRLEAAHGDYRLTLQLFLSNAGDSTKSVTELVRNWIEHNQYQVEELWVREPADALRLFVEGRRETAMWDDRAGYQLQDKSSAQFVQLGCNPISAYLEYRLFEITGETLWRDRAFKQMDVMAAAQITDPRHLHHGAINTIYDLRTGNIDSSDRGHNRGLKIDYNAHMVRYMLLTWERVKNHEGLTRQDWYDTAILCAEWLLRQQNPDGGMPQLIHEETGKPSNSVVSGRTLVALPVIARITGDRRYLACLAGMEEFLRREVEGRYWFTGAHVDLPPNDYEQDSMWCAVEYWLDKHDLTGEEECLDRALADAYLAFLTWCPKQLGWVANPTQCAHTEQQHFLQYSVYCYCNRKVQCLDRLARKTDDPLFFALTKRVLQANFFTQLTSGQVGAFWEAIADPWLARKRDCNWLGTAYMNQLSVDLMVQLVDMGLV